MDESERLDRAALVAGLQKRGVPAAFEDDVAQLVSMLKKTAADSDVVLVLSNGAFGGIHARLKDALG